MWKRSEYHVEYMKSLKGSSTAVRLSLVPYWLLAALRVLLTLVPQYGYVHPDEFFQSMEVMAGDVLDIDVTRPWEFNSTFPIRSVVMPYLTVGLPLTLLKSLAWYLLFWFDINIRTPYMLLILPRLASCFLSFIVDYSLYRICCVYGQNYRTRLITFASSYVILVYGTRTFSNLTEMVLTSLLLSVVADCMCYSDRVITQDEFLSNKYKTARTIVERVKIYKLRNALPEHSLTHCLAVATITVAGIFNRPTFIAFAFPPIFFWLHRGLGSRTIGFKDFHLRTLMFILSALPAIFTFIIIDSFYYGYLTNSEIHALKISMDNFVVTPLNFVKYNVVSKNLADHGLHPWYLHFLVNVPLLYNVLGVIGLAAFIKMVYRGACKQWSALPRIQSIIGLMTASFIIPISVLSVFPHQEARFLIPVTLPLVFLHSQRIRHNSDAVTKKENGAFKKLLSSNSDGNWLLTLWYLFNIILTAFYGFIHQGGVYPLMDHFSEELQSKPHLTALHVVTSHVYTLPLSLLQLQNNKQTTFSRETGQRYRMARQFHTYEMGSKPLDEVRVRLEELLESCEEKFHQKKLSYRLYLAIPASLSEEFHTVLYNSTSTFSHSVVRVFYPHVSTEALPKINTQSECSDNELLGFCEIEKLEISPLQYLTRFMEQFGLILFKIEK